MFSRSEETLSLVREPGPMIRSMTALVLRLALGLAFLVLGLGKFQSMRSDAEDKYPSMIIKSMENNNFKENLLTPAAVQGFAAILPYAEMALGLGLILGLATPITAYLTGLLLVALLFGQLAINAIDKIPSMFTYILMDAAVIWLSPVSSNYLSADGLLLGWFYKPRSRGTYRRDD